MGGLFTKKKKKKEPLINLEEGGDAPDLPPPLAPTPTGHWALLADAEPQPPTAPPPGTRPRPVQYGRLLADYDTGHYGMLVGRRDDVVVVVEQYASPDYMLAHHVGGPFWPRLVPRALLMLL